IASFLFNDHPPNDIYTLSLHDALPICLVKRVFLIVFMVTYSFSCTERREDHSRSVEDYMTLGMPDPGTKWTMEEYKQAYNVLPRSEEHTSELQSRENLVCRLLLEKKQK